MKKYLALALCVLSVFVSILVPKEFSMAQNNNYNQSAAEISLGTPIAK
jgi:hypothetical protein